MEIINSEERDKEMKIAKGIMERIKSIPGAPYDVTISSPIPQSYTPDYYRYHALKATANFFEDGNKKNAILSANKLDEIEQDLRDVVGSLVPTPDGQITETPLISGEKEDYKLGIVKSWTVEGIPNVLLAQVGSGEDTNLWWFRIN